MHWRIVISTGGGYCKQSSLVHSFQVQLREEVTMWDVSPNTLQQVTLFSWPWRALRGIQWPDPRPDYSGQI